MAKQTETTAPTERGVLATLTHEQLVALGRHHCMSRARNGLAPFACKCGRWSLDSLPEKGKAGSKTLRARLLRVSELYRRHLRAEGTALTQAERVS